jgi:hypothetical protein
VRDNWQRRKRDPLGVTISRIKVHALHKDWFMVRHRL